MSLITIREQQQTDAGFEATVTFDNSAEYPITISDPFTPQEETELEWYFEEWLVFPMLDEVKAKRAADSVKKYGEELFDQVFGDKKTYREYDNLKRNLSQLQIEIIGKTPEFQAFHWEALRDPELPRPLAVDCVMLRKTVNPSTIEAYVEPSPVINLLVVIARPDEESDVGYRTISRPLVELIDHIQLPVKIELLRPATYEALCKHLEEKGEGYYHIIHFDTHGALLTYEHIEQKINTNRYLYQRGYGLENLEPYPGVKAFLIFEGETKGKATPVEASELANLLTGKRIPVCILNACQSGKQVRSPLSPLSKGGTDNQETPPLQSKDGVALLEDSRETSLGSRLMAAGMQMVVAMGYSVTVSAAKLMMQQLYQHLFDEKEITTAIRLGRKELFNIKQRQAYFNYKIDLEDWLLPVTYYNRPVNLNLRKFTPQEKKAYYLSRRKRYRFSIPTYGFVGRDLEILKIEKMLLRHNILLLRGMGGTGKTTLLNYLREWWQTTNFAQKIFYFGYDEKAWTLQQIVDAIGKQVFEDEYDRAIFQATPIEAQVEELIDILRTQDYALMLDNLESVTGQQLAIQNTLPESEQNQIRDFLARLVGGETKIVLGSRSGEDWLKNTFNTNVYQLKGLDPESRSILGEKILEGHVATNQIEKIRKDENFQRLMKLLAGYPLAMEVVLANLKNQQPEEILSGLQAADIDLDTESEDKTKSIIQCVEYSHSNLSPEAQKLLLCLAPFSGFIYREFIPNYSQELQKLEQFQDYPFDQFDQAIQEAINWGLLLPINENYPELLAIQPVFPYFLKNKLRKDDSISEGLRKGFKNHYQLLADGYKQFMNSKDAQDRQWGIILSRLEYENLYNALQICLNHQEDFGIFVCLDEYFKLTSDYQGRVMFTEAVCQALEHYPPEFLQREIGYQIAFAFHRNASSYIDIQQYKLAKKSYQKALEAYQSLSQVEERQKQLWIAITYHQLGMVAQRLREYQQARSYYQQALDIDIEYGDRYHQASIYHWLGNLLLELREYEQARRYYQQALDIWIEYGDQYNQNYSYYQLGRVAQDLKEYQQARSYYQQALDINIEYGDRYEQARTYGQLGVLAEELGEIESAKTHLLQALQIYVEFNDEYYMSFVLSILDRIYKATQDETILAEVASILGMTMEEVRERLESEKE